jgi:hypothetical protein
MIRNALWGVALALSSAHAAKSAEGDFAPLAVGNTWVYSIDENGGAFWWNPRVSHLGRRTLRVESSAGTPGGGSIHVLSFRDSLFQRKWNSNLPVLPDTSRTGSFQVAQSAGDGRLSLLSTGNPIPPGMEVFFRRRFRSGGTAVSTGTGDSLYLVPVTATYNARLHDSAVYARDLGLLYLRRYYDVWGERGYTPGYLTTVYRLASFNGSPVTVNGFALTAAPGPQAAGFSGLRDGRSWRYRGLRQLVPGKSVLAGNHLRRDSVSRTLVVTKVTPSAGNSVYSLSIEDSLHHRTYDGRAVPDTVETGTASVRLVPDSLFLSTYSSMQYEDARDEIWIHFNRHSFLEEAVGSRDFGSGPVRIAEYRVGYPGLVEDTLIHAEGIGLIRRSKILLGSDPAMSERLDWRLVELDGRPFDATPVSIRRGRAPRTEPAPSPPAAGRGFWRLRDLLGRIQGP